MDLTGKTILVTGSNGFLGQHVCNQLAKRGLTDLGELSRNQQPKKNGFIRVRSANFDLTNQEQVSQCLASARPDIIIHLAASVGGIGINRQQPGTFYYRNIMMGTMLIEQARQHGCDKFVAIGSICAYPKHTPIPFREEDLWEGYPEETNAPYGIAKKAMLVQAQAYRQEFGFNTIYLLPVNLYGSNDNFDPDSSHVIPALIKKCIDARNNGDKTIECWGSGQASREFLHVTDAANAIVLATEQYNEAEPVNIGSGQEITISDLVNTIARLCRFTGKIVWNRDYPNGQPRRCLDVTRAKEKFGFQASTSLETGLAETIAWYEGSR